MPEAQSRSFFQSPSQMRRATLHVPASSLEEYESTSPWSSFPTIVPITDEDAVEEVKSAVLAEAARYDLQGRQQSAPQKGLNIIRYSDGSTRKVLVK